MFKRIYQFTITTALVSSLLTGVVQVNVASAIDNKKADSKQVTRKHIEDAKSEDIKKKVSEMISENGYKVKLGGKLDMQAGASFNSEFFNSEEQAIQFLSGNPAIFYNMVKEHKWGNIIGWTPNAEFSMSLSKDVNHNMKISADIEVQTDVSPTKTGGTSVGEKLRVRLDNDDIGAIEFGSWDGPNNSLKVDPAGFAAGLGGIDGVGALYIPYRTVGKFIPQNGTENTAESLYDLSSAYILEPYMPCASESKKKANKISLYSKNLAGVTLGLAYVPNTEVKGTLSELKKEQTKGFKNAIELAVKYEKELNDSLSGALSVGSEIGESHDFLYFETDRNLGLDSSRYKMKVKREGLRAGEIGGKLEMKMPEGYKLALAGSYGYWGKSGAPNSITTYDPKDAKKAIVTPVTPKGGSHYWTLGGLYSQDKLDISITFMRSSKWDATSSEILEQLYNYILDQQPKANKMQVISLGADYKIMPGVVLYGEVSNYKHEFGLEDKLIHPKTQEKITRTNADINVIGGGIKFKL